MFAKPSLVYYCQEGIIGDIASSKARVTFGTFISRSDQQALSSFCCSQRTYVLTPLRQFESMMTSLSTSVGCNMLQFYFSMSCHIPRNSYLQLHLAHQM